MLKSTSFLKAGFSLIEMLTVMAIIALLSAMSIPAFNAVATSHATSQGAYDMAGLLEYARSEALARQTYVWVGVQNSTDAVGNPEVIAGAVYSLDGTGTIVNQSGQTNLGNLSRVVHVRNSKLVSWSSLKSATQALLTNTTATISTPSDVNGSTSGITFSMGTKQFITSTVTFTPRGEVLLLGLAGQDDPFNPLISINFQQVRGSTVAPNAEEVSVVVNGATGMARILRIR